MEPSSTWLGYLAATCTTAAFLPQVIKTLKTRDTRSISLGMYVLFVTGVGLWMAYGIVLGDRPIILANGITFMLSAVILVMKARNAMHTD